MKKQKQPINETYRQGDILFIRADTEPKDGVQVERQDGRIVVALGEVTGHSHSVATESAQMYRDEALALEWLVAPDETDVLHQEHETLKLPAGTYWIVRQRQYQRGKVFKVYD